MSNRIVRTRFLPVTNMNYGMIRLTAGSQKLAALSPGLHEQGKNP
jgi:hypothetical protein